MISTYKSAYYKLNYTQLLFSKEKCSVPAVWKVLTHVLLSNSINQLQYIDIIYLKAMQHTGGKLYLYVNYKKFQHLVEKISFCNWFKMQQRIFREPMSFL